jgi:hypothetical protein
MPGGLPFQDLRQAEGAALTPRDGTSDASECGGVLTTSARKAQDFAQAEPDFARLMEVWDTLPEAVREHGRATFRMLLALAGTTASRPEGGSR